MCFVMLMLIFLFGLMFYIPLNSYGHFEMVSSHNLIFFLGKVDYAVNQYFLHILSLVTDNPSWNSGRRRMTVEIIS